MAVAYSTPEISCTQEPVNIDLIRRYCPSFPRETAESFAEMLTLTAQGCWVGPWALNKGKYGYCAGTPTDYGAPTNILMHRYMYEVFVYDIPLGNHVHHRCHMKRCWHPLHLASLTPKEHTEDHRRCSSQQLLPGPVPVSGVNNGIRSSSLRQNGTSVDE